MAFPLVAPKQQFFDDAGEPLSGGTIQFRNPSTDVYVNTYPTADDAEAGTNANDNPLTLDDRGEAQTGIFLNEGVSYKVILKDSGGSTIWTIDDVQAPISGSYLFGTYTYTPSGSSTSRTLQSRLDEIHLVSDYGAVGDGTTDDTTALNAAFTEAANGILIFPDGSKTYKFTGQLTIQDGTEVFFNDATLSCAYTPSASTVVIVGGDKIKLHDFKAVIPTGYVVDRVLNLGDQATVNGCTITSVDQQNNRDNTRDAAIRLVGSNISLNDVRVEDYDNAIGASAAGWNYINFHNIVIRNYVRGIWLDTSDYVTMTSVSMNTASANASTTAGHNGLLISDCRYSTFSNITINDAGEHAIRIGGDTAIRGLSFSNIVCARQGQCGFKAQGTVRGQDLTINGLQVIDCSFGGASGSNEDGLRVMDFENVNVTGFHCFRQDNAGTSAYDGIYIENCKYVNIPSPMIFDVANHGIHITDGGAAVDIDGIFIHGAHVAATLGDSLQIDVATAGSTLGGVIITDFYGQAATGYVYELDSTAVIIDNPVVVTGYGKSGGAGITNEVTPISDTLKVTSVTTIS